jgi:rhodanese-related sulfurtransferase/rubrerythrin
MFPEDLEDFVRDNPAGSYVLLDVRQPVEYERRHLPGAHLVPLPELPNSISQFDRQKTVIVYCAVGGRSRMAAQFLTHQGFRDVYHLQGGIEAWEQPAATGPVGLHLQFIRGDESPEEIVLLSYRMEDGLKRFHESVMGLTDDKELLKLLAHLIRAEERHEKSLMDLLSLLTGQDQKGVAGSSTSVSEVMEGGIDLNDFMEENKAYLKTVPGYIELAMMVETQALDLYLQMANGSRNVATKKVLLQIAEEERQHLAHLGRYIEESPYWDTPEDGEGGSSLL